MYQYVITTDIKDERIFSDISEISQDLQRLQNDADAFVVLEVSPPVNSVNYLQVANISGTKGFFKKRDVIKGYTVEINIAEKDGGFKQYQYMTEDFEEVKGMLVGYIGHLKTPDFSAWTDVEI